MNIRRRTLNDRPRNRRGFTLVETTAAGILFVVALASFTQVIGWVASERRAFERRRLAVAVASNIMERATSLPWDRIDEDSLRKLRLSDDARSALPEAKLVMDLVEENNGGIESKRMTLTIRWLARVGVQDRPVRLVAWVHRPRRTS